MSILDNTYLTVYLVCSYMLLFAYQEKEDSMEELEKQLEEVECRLFMLDMKDKWDAEDYELREQLNKEKKELEEKINGRK